MTGVLDLGIGDVFADRGLLDRTVRAIQLDQDASYVDALELLHAGADQAREAATGLAGVALDQEQRDRTLSLGGALGYAGVDVDYVGQAIDVLGRRDRAVTKAGRKAGKVKQLDVDSRGMVLTRQSRAKSTDVGRALHDAAERERRFLKARELDQRYASADGRQLFLAEDAEMLGLGVDIVRTARYARRRAKAAAAAQQQATVVAKQLDAAIQGSSEKRSALRLLDSKLGELEKDPASKTVGVDWDTARQQLAGRGQEPLSGVLKVLDQSGKGEGKPGRKKAEKAFLTLLDVSQSERDRAKAAGNSLPDGSYPINNVKQLRAAAVLAASKHGDWRSAQTLIRRRAAELGVDLSSLAGFASESPSRQMSNVANVELHQQVLDRIKLLDRDVDRDYATTLHEMLTGGEL